MQSAALTLSLYDAAAEVPHLPERTLRLPNERRARRPCGGSGRNGQGRRDCDPLGGVVRCSYLQKRLERVTHDLE